MMKMITVLLIGALSSFVLSGCIANKNDDSDHNNLTASTSKAANSTPAFEAYQQDPNPTTAFNYLFDVATHPRCVNPAGRLVQQTTLCQVSCGTCRLLP